MSQYLEVEIFSLEDSLVQSDSIGSLDVSVYWLPVLPPPGDVGVGNPCGFTDEAGVVFLPDGDRAGAALLVNDGGGHHHVQVAGLGDHGVRVDLAHVVTLVLGLDVLDVEGPGVVTVVDDIEPGDPGDDVPPDGEDHLAVYVDPGHLVVRQLRHHTLQGGLPAQGRRDVADVLRDVGTSPAYWK